MTTHSPEPPHRRWFVHVIGIGVFGGILYFCLRRFLDLSVGVSLTVALPVGLVAFCIFAHVMEDMDTPPGFRDDPG